VIETFILESQYDDPRSTSAGSNGSSGLRRRFWPEAAMTAIVSIADVLQVNTWYEQFRDSPITNDVFGVIS